MVNGSRTPLERAGLPQPQEAAINWLYNPQALRLSYTPNGNGANHESDIPDEYRKLFASLRAAQGLLTIISWDQREATVSDLVVPRTENKKVAKVTEYPADRPTEPRFFWDTYLDIPVVHPIYVGDYVQGVGWNDRWEIDADRLRIPLLYTNLLPSNRTEVVTPVESITVDHDLESVTARINQADELLEEQGFFVQRGLRPKELFKGLIEHRRNGHPTTR